MRLSWTACNQVGFEDMQKLFQIIPLNSLQITLVMEIGHINLQFKQEEWDSQFSHSLSLCPRASLGQVVALLCIACILRT